ncbi:hypothetical protein SLA2020_404620 [Shorea laevis]
MLSLLRSINKNQTEILTCLDNLEKASATQSTQLKQLKLDVNNILGHVTPKKTTATNVIHSYGSSSDGSSSSTTAASSTIDGSGDEDEQMVDVATDDHSSSLPVADAAIDAATNQDQSKSRTKKQHDG